MLRLIANAGAVPVMLDEPTGTVEPEMGDRTVLIDDNTAISLIYYSADRRTAISTLDSVRAIRLGNQLVAPGVRRL